MPAIYRKACGPIGSCILSFMIAATAFASPQNQWPSDPAINVPVCIESGIEELASLCPDQHGGNYLLWRSERKGGIQSRLQRLLLNGRSAWSANGVRLCATDISPFSGQTVADGAGGVIATWADYGHVGNVYSQIRTQHLNPRGQLLWDTAGVLVDSTAYWYHAFESVSDGHGGIFVVSTDVRNDPFGPATLYAQWIDASGHARWANGGVPFCSAVSYKRLMSVVSDGQGGFMALWEDERARDWHYLLYAQRMDAAGHQLWQTDGVLVSDQLSEDRDPALVTDGSGGAITSWSSVVVGVLAQHVNAAGQLVWASPGVDVTDGNWTTKDPDAIPDGTGGAIICWADARSGGWTPYVQHLLSDGSLAWNAGGVSVSSVHGGEWARLASDGMGGVFTTWGSVDNYIWAQRIMSNGQLATGWSTAGVAVSTAVGGELYPQIMAVPKGAVIAWNDYRNNGLADIYAQRVGISGVLGGAAEDDSRDRSAVVAITAFPGVVAAGVMSLDVRGGKLCDVRFNLPRASWASLRVYNVSGTLVATVFAGSQPAGTQRTTWDASALLGEPIPRGVYTFVLETPTETRQTHGLVIAPR